MLALVKALNTLPFNSSTRANNQAAQGKGGAGTHISANHVETEGRHTARDLPDLLAMQLTSCQQHGDPLIS